MTDSLYTCVMKLIGKYMRGNTQTLHGFVYKLTT